MPTPDDPDQLVELCNKHDIAHLIGHWDAASNEVQLLRSGSEPLCLTCDTVRAYGIGRVGGSLILSVCKVGQLKAAANLAVAINELRNVAVWTPLTSIRENDATRLDNDVTDFVYATRGDTDSGNRSLGEFFKNRRQREPWTHVYVRYGL